MTDFPRYLLSLTLIPLATIAFARARQENATITYLDGSAQSCKIVQKDDQTWLLESTAKKWGWKFSGQSFNTTISVNGLTAQIDTQKFDGQIYFPVERSLRQLDAELIPIGGDHLNLRIVSHIRVVRYEGGHLEISSSLPFSPQYKFSDKQTLQVDAEGATLSPDVILDLGPGISLTQPNHHEVHFQVDNVAQMDLSKQPSSSTNSIDLNLQPSPLPVPSSNSNTIFPIQVHFDVNKEGGSVLRFPLAHAVIGYPILNFINPSTVQIRFKGIRLSPDGPAIGDNEYVKSVEIEPHDDYSIATVTLAKSAGFIALNLDKEFQLRFYPQDMSSVSPFMGGTPKIVTIDPGHGGKDSGADNDPQGIKEKNLTIAIGYQLAEDLSKRGAVVYLTRASDVFIPLSDRTAIATANHSILFASVHINSTNNRTTSGSIVFYHGSNAPSRSLAVDMENEVAKASTIPKIGSWSDTRIYNSGFYVLRNATMPAVLCELGFINNPKDLKSLCDPSIQSKIADQLEKGIEDYLNDSRGQ